MKQFFTGVLIFSVCSIALCQSRYKTSEGTIRFNASTPLEDILATNNTVNAILDLETGDFAVVMLIKEFTFRRKLMQEHFNENYMHSDTYPKAFFRGKISGLEDSVLSESGTALQLLGELTIHGVTRELKTSVELTRANQVIRLASAFVVRPESHGIEVPKILFKKIAEEVTVDVAFELSAQPAKTD